MMVWTVARSYFPGSVSFILDQFRLKHLSIEAITSIFALPDNGVAGILGVFEIVMRHCGVE
jgi:hypothetical protein